MAQRHSFCSLRRRGAERGPSVPYGRFLLSIGTMGRNPVSIILIPKTLTLPWPYQHQPLCRASQGFQSTGSCVLTTEVQGMGMGLSTVARASAKEHAFLLKLLSQKAGKVSDSNCWVSESLVDVKGP